MNYIVSPLAGVVVLLPILSLPGQQGLLAGDDTSTQVPISFALPVSHDAPYSPLSILATDFDGDGLLDLAVLGPLELTVVSNQGDGVFSDPVSLTGRYSHEDDAQVMTLIDLDGDGDLDAAMTRNLKSEVDDRLLTFFNLDRGEFLKGQQNLSSGSWAHGLEAGDFDHDGDQDVVVANLEPRTFRLFQNTGVGILIASRVSSVGAEPYGILSADLDGDGDIDLATLNKAAANVSVFLNDGSGGFGSPSNFDTGGGPLKGIARDFDADGDLDILTANGSSFAVLANAGDGTFGAPRLVRSDHHGFSDLSLADFNGDGVLELATCNTGSDSVSVFLADGLQGFVEALNLPAVMDPDPVIGIHPHPQCIVAADLDGDGDPDLAAGFSFAKSLWVYRNETVQGAFRRGDADGDGERNISDAILTLQYLFEEVVKTPGCLKALDSNDDGRVDVSDPISLLGFLFLSSPASLPGPSEACGVGTTPNGLECKAQPGCAGGS